MKALSTLIFIFFSLNLYSITIEDLKKSGQEQCEEMSDDSLDFGDFIIIDEDKFLKEINFSDDNIPDYIVNWGEARCENSASAFTSNGGTNFNVYINDEFYYFWVHDIDIYQKEDFKFLQVFQDGHTCDDPSNLISGCYEFYTHNDLKRMNDKSCENERDLQITSKYVGGYKVDILKSKNTLCDSNRIIFSKINEFGKYDQNIIGEDFGRSAANTISFLENQNFKLDNYVWFEWFPSSRNYYTFGYFFPKNSKPIKIQDPSLTNCKYVSEDTLQCLSETDRDYNITCKKIPYDTIIYEFNENNFTKDVLKQEPIPEECLLNVSNIKSENQYKEPKNGCTMVENMSTGEIEEVCE